MNREYLDKSQTCFTVAKHRADVDILQSQHQDSGVEALMNKMRARMIAQMNQNTFRIRIKILFMEIQVLRNKLLHKIHSDYGATTLALLMSTIVDLNVIDTEIRDANFAFYKDSEQASKLLNKAEENYNEINDKVKRYDEDIEISKVDLAKDVSMTGESFDMEIDTSSDQAHFAATGAFAYHSFDEDKLLSADAIDNNNNDASVFEFPNDLANSFEYQELMDTLEHQVSDQSFFQDRTKYQDEDASELQEITLWYQEDHSLNQKHNTGNQDNLVQEKPIENLDYNLRQEKDTLWNQVNTIEYQEVWDEDVFQTFTSKQQEDKYVLVQDKSWHQEAVSAYYLGEVIGYQHSSESRNHGDFSIYHEDTTDTNLYKDFSMVQQDDICWHSKDDYIVHDENIPEHQKNFLGYEEDAVLRYQNCIQVSQNDSQRLINVNINHKENNTRHHVNINKNENNTGYPENMTGHQWNVLETREVILSLHKNVSTNNSDTTAPKENELMQRSKNRSEKIGKFKEIIIKDQKVKRISTGEKRKAVESIEQDKKKNQYKLKRKKPEKEQKKTHEQLELESKRKKTEKQQDYYLDSKITTATLIAKQSDEAKKLAERNEKEQKPTKDKDNEIQNDFQNKRHCIEDLHRVEELMLQILNLYSSSKANALMLEIRQAKDEHRKTEYIIKPAEPIAAINIKKATDFLTKAKKAVECGDYNKALAYLTVANTYYPTKEDTEDIKKAKQLQKKLNDRNKMPLAQGIIDWGEANLQRTPATKTKRRRVRARRSCKFQQSFPSFRINNNSNNEDCNLDRLNKLVAYNKERNVNEAELFAMAAAKFYPNPHTKKMLKDIANLLSKARKTKSTNIDYKRRFVSVAKSYIADNEFLLAEMVLFVAARWCPSDQASCLLREIRRKRIVARYEINGVGLQGKKGNAANAGYFRLCKKETNDNIVYGEHFLRTSRPWTLL